MINLLYLLQVDLPEVANGKFDWVNAITFLIGGGGLGLLARAIIAWIRNKKIDTATAGKTDADAEKVKAEAYEIKVKADISLLDSCYILIDKMTVQNDMTKKQLEKTQDDLDNALKSLNSATDKLNLLQEELKHEKEKNEAMALEIITLTNQLNGRNKPA